MDSLADNILALVLARLPIKIFTAFKLVCKKWKSIVESPSFRNLFLSMHQNSASSSWSLMSILYTDHVDPEIVGYHYQCDTWGLKRPVGSFIKSFLNDQNPNHKYLQVSAVAYSDVGLILVYATSKIMENSSLYVANPVSRECVEIFMDPLPKGVERSQFCFWQWGIATRTENGIVLGYTIVVFNQKWRHTKLSCLIYSSETGLWSLDDTSFPNYQYSLDSISLNGSLHWFARNSDNQEVVLSMDFNTNNNSTGSDRCFRVTPFPDLGRTTKFRRACTPCRGSLMYMNIVCASVEEKLCVWRLQSEGWQLISEIFPGPILTGYDFEYSLMTINPIDANTAYFWSTKHESLLYINLHNGKSVTYNQFELTSDGRATMIPAHDPRAVISLKKAYFETADLLPFILPQWLYRIRNT
ncbi:F-box family protein-related [Raphanus sativus]|uniref:F-box protein At3g28330-like n=1 Tax=Raphanus sativus TaxID=3726 RepID=A0A6J0N3C8_RAPSA|nr:F-box protein At3g28330-like [Raphanus sativus]KAJ4899659.1 F-box family protein-related [Raphanus sativus]